LISWQLFEKDPGTEAILLIGEIGGRQEDEAAEYFKKNMSKPMAAFIAGQNRTPWPPAWVMLAPIIEGASGTALEKMKNLERAGIRGRLQSRSSRRNGCGDPARQTTIDM